MSLQTFWDRLGDFLPEQLIFKGGGPVIFAAVGVIALFVGSIVWKAAVDAATKLIEPWLAEHRRGMLVLILGLPIIAAAALGQNGTAVVMAAIALLAGVMLRLGRLTWGTGALVAAVASMLMVSFLVEAKVRERRKHAEDKRLTVYVVFPFRPSKGEDLATLRSLSQSLRDTVDEILGSLADVRIKPESVTADEDLNHYQKIDNVVQRLRSEGVEPDILLVNTSRMTDEPRQAATKYLTVVLRPRIPRKEPGPSRFDTKQPIRKTGLRQDVTYLAVRATLALVEQIKTMPDLPLKPEAEKEILRNAATKYIEELDSDEKCPGPACDAARAALNAPSFTLAQIIAITNQYPPDEARRVRQIDEARAAAATGKITSPESPAPVEPTPQPASAPPAGPAAAKPASSEARS